MASPFVHKVRDFLQRHFASVCRPLQSAAAAVEYSLLDCWWALRGFRKPSDADARFVAENVTFMFKSFERQNQARALYRSIRKHYPEVRIVIADDSSRPLTLPLMGGEDKVTVVQLPFNSGLNKGLVKALEQVSTPFLVRMDDDELLTRHLNVAEELRFLQAHPEVDLVAFPCIEGMKSLSVKKFLRPYYKITMADAPLPLLVAHGTKIDESHVVLGKVPNIFLARTESVRKVGWDENIRMIDHHDFFFRAAGILVSAVSLNSVVFHNHNYFKTIYNKFRSDWKGDAIYISRTRRRRTSKG